MPQELWQLHTQVVSSLHLNPVAAVSTAHQYMNCYTNTDSMAGYSQVSMRSLLNISQLLEVGAEHGYILTESQHDIHTRSALPHP